MDQDQLQSKVRTLRQKVDDHAGTLEKIVDAIITKYNRDLNEYIERMKDLLSRSEDLTDSEIERSVLRIPLFMYFASTGLESLGIEGDSAKAIKMQVFNEAYSAVEGTIQDKTKHAELQTFPEYLIEVAYTRAYKKLKTQIEMAEHIFSGAKKVLSKRMLDIEIGLRDNGALTNRRRLNDE